VGAAPVPLDTYREAFAACFAQIHPQEKTFMSKQPSKNKIKRLAKSKRTHVRRMKQEAQQNGIVYKPEVQWS
jgi:hypothetical protein